MTIFFVLYFMIVKCNQTSDHEVPCFLLAKQANIVATHVVVRGKVPGDVILPDWNR